MGQSNSVENNSPEHKIPETVGVIQDEVFRHARILSEIATLTYEDFQKCLGQLNSLAKKVTDHEGKKLIFAVKKGTDSTVLWKGTVRIACVKMNPDTKEIDSYRLVNLNQFLKIFQTLQCQLSAALQSSESEMLMSCSMNYGETKMTKKSEESNSDSGSAYSDDSSYHQSVSENSTSSDKTTEEIINAPSSSHGSSRQRTRLQDTKRLTASMILEEVDHLTYCFSGSGADKLGECCICLERKPDVMLPCAHAYCLPCIEQWNTAHKTCPICRDRLESTDDTWVISDIPGSQEISQEICSALMELTTSPK